jgi:hypothetical protein
MDHSALRDIREQLRALRADRSSAKRDKVLARRAEKLQRSHATLSELENELAAEHSQENAEQQLLRAVRENAARLAVVPLLSQPDPSHRRLAIKVGSALCRDLLPAFARSEAAAVIQAEQRLAFARVLCVWLPLPGAPRPTAPGGEDVSFMEAIRAQMLAEWSVSQQRSRPRRFLPAREPQLHRWYGPAAAAVADAEVPVERDAPDPCAFYRRRSYDTPRGSTAEDVSALRDLVAMQRTTLSSAVRETRRNRTLFSSLAF